MDQAQQWQELKETYSCMSEDELCQVAEDACDLVPLAREVLQTVIKERSLDIQLATAPHTDVAGNRDDPEGVQSDEEDDLVSVRTLHSREEAVLAKSILDANFIASCLGPGEIADLSDFTASFDNGVDLRVFAHDARRAREVLDEFAPEEKTEEEIDAENAAENASYAITCPKCHSQEVALEGTDQPGITGAIAGKYNWTCTDCGYQWQDDGIARAVGSS